MGSPAVHPMWRSPPADILARIAARVDRALGASGTPLPVFFRADDIGVPGRSFETMMACFESRRTPLCLALVPAWCTRPRWEVLFRYERRSPGLWCWHQHGWRHRNHEPAGKKAELGSSRTREAVETDLRQGKERLSTLLGEAFCPVFTPPWNRMSAGVLEAAKNLGFRAVSRNHGATPLSFEGLPDLYVDVDLHTLPPGDTEAAWSRVLDAFESAVRRGRCGIMLHHQRMNAAAHAFLSSLVAMIGNDKRLRIVHFGDLLTHAP